MPTCKLTPMTQMPGSSEEGCNWGMFWNTCVSQCRVQFWKRARLLLHTLPTRMVVQRRKLNTGNVCVFSFRPYSQVLARGVGIVGVEGFFYLAEPGCAFFPFVTSSFSAPAVLLCFFFFHTLAHFSRGRAGGMAFCVWVFSWKHCGQCCIGHPGSYCLCLLCLPLVPAFRSGRTRTFIYPSPCSPPEDMLFLPCKRRLRWSWTAARCVFVYIFVGF
eukprot:RCo001536